MSKCTQWADVATLECKAWANEISASCTEWKDEGTAECKQWADHGSNQCSQWADEGSNECSQWADEGSNECTSWSDQGHNECCNWAPCSWFCDAFYWVANWVCQGWYWVAKWVCKAWYWVAKWVCKAWYWVAKWVCVAWYWVANLVCQAWAFIVKVVCTIWNWVVKTICVAWTTVVCFFNWIAQLWRKKRRAPRIRHVFVLMLENRSYDHMLGFAGLQGTDAKTQGPTSADDLVGNPRSNVDPVTGNPVLASTPADFKLSATDRDPPHEFEHALQSLCGTGATWDPMLGYPPIDNSGFVAVASNGGSPTAGKVMDCYDPVKQLPILTTLAREFAVCDQWFSSMPGPTWPNRFFVHAATSAGLDDSPSSFDVVTSSALDGYRFAGGTIFDRLDDNCLEWEIFEGDEMPQAFAISGMTLNALQGRFTDMDEFADAVTSGGFDKSYIFIEPSYGNIIPEITPGDYTCGTSQHPLDDVTRGERLIKNVYETLRRSRIWNNSVLVITYDEHGGFHDHVPPPAGVPPGDAIIDASNVKHEFDFSQLGVRVPAVVVSPLIPRGTIDHTRYDHASVPATLERLFGLKSMTRRDATANDLLHLFRLGAPRTDCPERLPDVPDSGFVCRDLFGNIREGGEVEAMVEGEPPHRDQKLPASFWGFLQVAARRQLAEIPIENRRERRRARERYLDIRTDTDAVAYFTDARLRVRAERRRRRLEREGRKQT